MNSSSLCLKEDICGGDRCEDKGRRFEEGIILVIWRIWAFFFFFFLRRDFLGVVFRFSSSMVPLVSETCEL